MEKIIKKKGKVNYVHVVVKKDNLSVYDYTFLLQTWQEKNMHGNRTFIGKAHVTEIW